MALGEQPRETIRGTYDFYRSYGRDPEHLIRLGARQLKLLAQFAVPADLALSYLTNAVKLGTSTFPPYAHRVAVLTSNLAGRADHRDSATTARLLLDFNRQQAARIQSAGDAHERLAEQAQAGGDEFALPDAYRTLAEGILRPFGSLLVQLARVAVREGSASFSVFHTLGEIEDAMSVFNRIRPPTGQLPDLLALALDRPMRNYAAHEDIVRSATGELAVIDASGSMMLVDLELLREHLLMLGSFLAGVDVAISVVFTAVSLHLPNPADTLKTEAFVGALAGCP